MIKINQVFNNSKESATLAINQQVKAMRREGKQVYHFGFGESPFPMPEKLTNSLIQHAHLNQYLPCAGLPALRTTINQFMKRFFGINHFEDRGVFIGPGSKELLFQLIYCLEHEVLIPAPSWVSYLPQTLLAKKGYQIVPTKAEDNYCLDPEMLSKYLDANKPQVLILNSPNNPTGAVYSKSRLEQLASVCRMHGTIVLSDEIYAAVNFSGDKHRSLSNYYPEGTIITSGLSKMFSAGGYRLGFACIPETLSDLYAPLTTMISETYSAVATPIQYAANVLLSDYDVMKKYIERTVASHAFVSTHMVEALSKTQIVHSDPKGAFYMLIHFQHYREALASQGITTDKQLGQFLLERYGFAALPGSEFYLDPADLSFRITTVDYDGKAVLDAQKLDSTLYPNIEGGMRQLQRCHEDLLEIQSRQIQPEQALR